MDAPRYTVDTETGATTVTLPQPRLERWWERVLRRLLGIDRRQMIYIRNDSGKPLVIQAHGQAIKGDPNQMEWPPKS